MPDPLYTLRPPHGPLASAPTLAENGMAVTNDVYRLLFGDGTENHVLAVKHNLSASAAPGVGDDSTDGYSPGSLWIDATNSLAYICKSAAAGAAAWQLIGSSSSSSLDIAGLTAADPADADELPVYKASATANRKVTVQELTALGGLIPGGRLTDGTSDPWFGGSGGSTIYYLPVYHSRLPLWDGTRWLNVGYSDSGLSLALSGLTAARPYDVFVYSSSGTATLELLAWSSDTARATGVSIQDGRYCKTGDKTRLYLGTIYTATTSSISRSVTREPIWNMYHRGRREMWATKTSGTHTYASGTWRSANADNAYRCEFVRGLNAEAVSADVRVNTSGASCAGRVGVGLDRTNANDAQVVTEAGHDSAGTIVYTATARYVGRPAAGYHYVQWVESVRAGTVTYRADLTGMIGMTVEVWA